MLYRDEEETIVMITTSLDGTFRVVCSADTGLPTKENRINIACLLTVVVIHGWLTERKNVVNVDGSNFVPVVDGAVVPRIKQRS